MCNYCNEKLTKFFCCHGGECKPNKVAHKVQMGSSDSVTAKMLLNAPISGCPVPPPAKPCTQVTQILTGLASDYEVGGSPPALSNVVALTDGGPPGVVTASGPVGSCVLSAGSSRTAPRHPAAGSTPATKPKNPLTFSLRLDGTFLLEKKVSRGWLPDGVTVTVVQPGKPTYWQTQFVRLKPGDVPTVVETGLPADRDTFVVITSHPGVNDIGMLELIGAPPPLVGVGTGTDVKPLAGWTQAAKTYADVIAAAPSKSGVTAAVVARANLPWAEPSVDQPDDVPVGLVLRPPQWIAAKLSPELLLRPAYPELLRLAAALDAAEPLVHEESRLADEGRVVERMSLASFCKQVKDGGDTLYEKCFAQLSDAAPGTVVLPRSVTVHLRGVPQGTLDHLIVDEPLCDYALKLHVRRTKKLATRVLLLLMAVRQLFGDNEESAKPLAIDYQKFGAASPFFLGTVKLAKTAPPALAIVYAARTGENDAAQLVDRGLTVIDRGLNLLVLLQSVIDEADRALSAEVFKEWNKWMAESVARWECAVEKDGAQEPPAFGKLFNTPARGWPLLIKRAEALSGVGWTVVSKQGAIREQVGAARDRLMRWAALRPDSNLIYRLVKLTDPVEELAGKLSLKDLSDLDKHAKHEARLTKQAAKKLAQAERHKAGGRLKKADLKASESYAATLKARGLDGARNADVRRMNMRWLVAPLVVIRVMNFVAGEGLKTDPTKPHELEVLRQVSAVGELFKMVTEPVLELTDAALDAKILAAETKAASFGKLATKELDALKAQKALKADLAKSAKVFGHALKVVQTAVALGDAWVDWRRGDRTAAGLEVLSVVVQFGTSALNGIPVVGPLLSFVASWAASEAFARWIREAKASGDDLALRELLTNTEFGVKGVRRADDGNVERSRAVAVFEDSLYRGRCVQPGCKRGEDIRIHLYQRQLTPWLTRLPAGGGLDAGTAAGMTVQFQPIAAQSRFVRARLQAGAVPTDRLPFQTDLTADAVLGKGKDGKAVYTAKFTIADPPRPETPVVVDLSSPEAPFILALGRTTPLLPLEPVVVKAADCLAADLGKFAGAKVPALKNLAGEPVFFLDPWCYLGDPLTIEDVEIPEGGSAWLVFGPAPPAQDLRTDIRARNFADVMSLDVLTPVGAKEKRLALRIAHLTRFLSMQRARSAGLTDSTRACAVFKPVLEVEVLHREYL